MKPSLEDLLVVAISSRALFNLEEENEVFESAGEDAYEALQYERLEIPAREGVAFRLVKKLLSFNTSEAQSVEVVVLSRNDPVTGLRIFRSAQHHGLQISRAAFLGGASPYSYLAPLKADLFLSANADDVKEALTLKVPAARVYARSATDEVLADDCLRIAFDGDSVLFDDEAERIFHDSDLPTFHAYEKQHAREPLEPGPLQPFLLALHRLQRNPPRGVSTRIVTALVTSRDAPAHERAMRTLLHWNVKVDQAFFLGGLPKTEFLHAFNPDFFFDDQIRHCEPAADSINTGHVDYGVANEPAAHP